MTTPGDRVKLIASESGRIKQYLNTLPADAWSRPSACDAWEVRDVVAHLIGATEMYTGNISRGVRGDSSPPESLAPAGAVDTASRMAANAQRAIDFRKSLGEQLLPTFAAKSDALNQVLTGLGPQDWDKPCYHPARTIPVRTFLNLAITELVVHEWDIRSRLESPAHLSGESLPAIVDLIPVFVIGRLFQPGSNLTTPVRYRFELTGAVSGRHDIVVGDGTARMEPAGTAVADVTFRCDTETFVLLAYGRTTLGTAVADGLIAVEGDRELVAQFGQ